MHSNLDKNTVILINARPSVLASEAKNLVIRKPEILRHFVPQNDRVADN